MHALDLQTPIQLLWFFFTGMVGVRRLRLQSGMADGLQLQRGFFLYG
jgi:hypothetical protein